MCYALEQELHCVKQLQGTQQEPVRTVLDGPGLLDLPQELLDVVFDLACPRIKAAKFYTENQWKEREVTRRRENHEYIKRAFPSLKVDDFMVSKHFFILAAKAFIVNQLFERGLQFSTGRGCGSAPSGAIADFVIYAVICRCGIL